MIMLLWRKLYIKNGNEKGALCMVTLYSTGCPRCSVIKQKLEAKGIDFVINSDVKKMKSLGMKTAPGLEVNGTLLDFAQANSWVNAQ